MHFIINKITSILPTLYDILENSLSVFKSILKMSLIIVLFGYISPISMNLIVFEVTLIVFICIPLIPTKPFLLSIEKATLIEGLSTVYLLSLAMRKIIVPLALIS